MWKPPGLGVLDHDIAENTHHFSAHLVMRWLTSKLLRHGVPNAAWYDVHAVSDIDHGLSFFCCVRLSEQPNCKRDGDDSDTNQLQRREVGFAELAVGRHAGVLVR